MALSRSTLPRAPDGLTAAWLSDALQRRVRSLEVTEIIPGTATKVRLAVIFANDPEPVALCAKGGFDEKLFAFGVGPAYVHEASFFGELAPELEIRLPGSWYAGVDSENQQGIVILDDLVATGASFGDPTEPWPVDRVAAGLEVLAGLHAECWGQGNRGLEWLHVGAAPVRAAAVGLLSAQHWESHFAIAGAPVLPPELQDRDRLQKAFAALWAIEDSSPDSVSHGDAHIGNTYIDAAGRPGFLDWQTVCLGPWSYDVSYFVGGALTVSDRRAAERELLDHYLRALAAGGAPRIDPDDAWLAYRRHALHGFFWAVTPAIMQPLDRVVAMAERHIAAIGDLDSFEALGV